MKLLERILVAGLLGVSVQGLACMCNNERKTNTQQQYGQVILLIRSWQTTGGNSPTTNSRWFLYVSVTFADKFHCDCFVQVGSTSPEGRLVDHMATNYETAVQAEADFLRFPDVDMPMAHGPWPMAVSSAMACPGFVFRIPHLPVRP